MGCPSSYPVKRYCHRRYSIGSTVLDVTPGAVLWKYAVESLEMWSRGPYTSIKVCCV